MLTGTLPAMPAPNDEWQALVVSFVVAACVVGALCAVGSTLLRKVVAVVFLVASLVAFVGTTVAGRAQYDARLEKVLAAIEAHWDVTHVEGHVLDRWVGDVDGEIKQCQTFNDDHLVVVCDGQEPAIRR